MYSQSDFKLMIFSSVDLLIIFKNFPEFATVQIR